MSLLPSQSWITANNPFFLLANVSTLTATNIETSNLACIKLSTGQATVSSIIGTEGGVNIDFAFVSSLNSDGKIEANEFSSIFTYAQVGTVSTLLTQHIVLDQATLDVVNGDVLLLNGIPLATTSTSISSLQDWAFYPAIQTVDMNSFGLSNVGNINSQNIFNALNIQSDTFSGLTSITAPSGTITNIRTSNLSTNNLQVNTINNGGNTNWLSPLSVSSLGVSTLSLNSLSLPVLQAGGLSSLTVSTGTLAAGTINGQPYISGSNWSQYPAITNVQMGPWTLNSSNNLNFNASSNTNFATAGDFTITADGGINVASITDVAITAQNGNRGQISLIAEPGNNNGVAGTINLTANGGSVGGVGTGGTINITANTPIGLSNLTSKISLSASGINSYAGSIPPLASIYGYNFIYGQNGVNICGGLPPGALPNTVGTTYIYGTLGVEIPSQAYMYGIEPYWNGLTTPGDLVIQGRYIIPNLAQVCVQLSNVKIINFQSNVATYMSNLDTLSMSSNGSITTSNISATTGSVGTLGFTTLNGTTVNTSALNANTVVASNSVQSPLLSTVSLNLSNMNSGAVRVGQKSLVVVGDVAQIQASNVAGQQGTLNLLMRQNYAEIQSFNSNFTAPLDLRFKADNFGFNLDQQNIAGGFEVDISGATIVENAYLKVGNRAEAGTEIYPDHTVISTIRQPVIQYGNITTTGGSGSSNVVLPVPYASVRYNIQVSMNDTNPAQLSVVNVDSNNFDIYWANGGGGTHSINWLTAGDLS